MRACVFLLFAACSAAREQRVPIREGKCPVPELRTYSVLSIGEKR